MISKLEEINIHGLFVSDNRLITNWFTIFLHKKCVFKDAKTSFYMQKTMMFAFSYDY